MVLKLLENLRRSGSALFLDRDIQKSKGEFGQVLYDQVAKVLEEDIQRFVSTDDDPLIVTVRPALLKAHREVKALEMKRVKAQRIVDEQERAAAAQAAIQATSNSTSTVQTSLRDASQKASHRWSMAKYKSQVVLYDEKMQAVKEEFGVAVYDVLVALQEQDPEWQPTDPLVQTALSMCRENVERLESLKSNTSLMSSNHNNNNNGALQDQVASTLSALETTTTTDEPPLRHIEFVREPSETHLHDRNHLENEVTAALATLEAAVLSEDREEPQQSTEESSSLPAQADSNADDVLEDTVEGMATTETDQVKLAEEEAREVDSAVVVAELTVNAEDPVNDADADGESVDTESESSPGPNVALSDDIAVKTKADPPVVEKGAETMESGKEKDANASEEDEAPNNSNQDHHASGPGAQKEPVARESTQKTADHPESGVDPSSENNRGDIVSTNSESAEAVDYVENGPVDDEASIVSDNQQDILEHVSEAASAIPGEMDDLVDNATENYDPEASESGKKDEDDTSVEYVEEVEEEEEAEEVEYVEEVEKEGDGQEVVDKSAASTPAGDESDSDDENDGSYVNSDSEESEDDVADLDDGDDSSFSLSIHGEMDPSSIGSVDPLRLVEKVASPPSVKDVNEEKSGGDDGDCGLLLTTWFAEDVEEVTESVEQQSSTEVEDVEETVRSESEAASVVEDKESAESGDDSDNGVSQNSEIQASGVMKELSQPESTALSSSTEPLVPCDAPEKKQSEIVHKAVEVPQVSAVVVKDEKLDRSDENSEGKPAYVSSQTSTQVEEETQHAIVDDGEEMPQNKGEEPENATDERELLEGAAPSIHNEAPERETHKDIQPENAAEGAKAPQNYVAQATPDTADEKTNDEEVTQSTKNTAQKEPDETETPKEPLPFLPPAQKEREEVVLRKVKVEEKVKREPTPAELEEVELKKAEIVKKEYEWEKPEWAEMPLVIGKSRADGETLHGDAMDSSAIDKMKPSDEEKDASLAAKVELRRAEVIKNEYTWEKPEWVKKAPLRSVGPGISSTTKKNAVKKTVMVEDDKPEFAKKALSLKSSGHHPSKNKLLSRTAETETAEYVKKAALLRSLGHSLSEHTAEVTEDEGPTQKTKPSSDPISEENEAV